MSVTSRPRGSVADVFGNMTLEQKMNVATALAFFVALPSMVFLRRRIGFRRVKISYLLVMALILMAIGAFYSPTMPSLPAFIPTGRMATPSFGAHHGGVKYHVVQTFPGTPFPVTTLGLFGAASFVVGVVQNRLRWRDICQGVRWHTYSTGQSWLSFLPCSTYITHRFLDPLVCIVVGFFTLRVSPTLGSYLMISGLALAAFEQVMYDKALEKDLDTLDGLVSAEVQRETVTFFLSEGQSATAKATHKPRSLQETGGIATGLAPDIERQIALRRGKLIGETTAIAPAGNSQADKAASDALAAFLGKNPPPIVPLAVSIPAHTPSVQHAAGSAIQPAQPVQYDMDKNAPDNLA